MSKHTPKPWHAIVHEDSETICVLGADKDHQNPVIAWPGFDDLGVKPFSIRVADAQISAAAPDLLEACRLAKCMLMAHIDTLAAGSRVHTVIVNALKVIDAAIAKAEGREP